MVNFIKIILFNSSIKVLSKWDQILRTHPRSCDLWIEYLNYRQSDFTSFTINSCVEEFRRCISVLRREKEYVIDCKYLIYKYVYILVYYVNC